MATVVAGNADFSGATGQTSFGIGFIGATTAGNLLVAVYGARDDGNNAEPVFTVSSGWSIIGVASPMEFHTVGIAWRVADGSATDDGFVATPTTGTVNSTWVGVVEFNEAGVSDWVVDASNFNGAGATNVSSIASGSTGTLSSATGVAVIVGTSRTNTENLTADVGSTLTGEDVHFETDAGAANFIAQWLSLTATTALDVTISESSGASRMGAGIAVFVEAGGVTGGSVSGAIAWAGSATGATVKSGSASGAIGWAGSADGATVHSGDAAGTVGWAGSATGAATHAGAAAGAISWDGSATGATDTAGDATGTVTWAGTATGASTHLGAASGAITWAGSADGSTVHSGTGDGAITWAGSATGEAPLDGVNSGSASGAIGWAGSATGSTVTAGAAAGAISWDGSATGATVTQGSAAGAIGWAGTATATVTEPALTISVIPAATSRRSSLAVTHRSTRAVTRRVTYAESRR